MHPYLLAKYLLNQGTDFNKSQKLIITRMFTPDSRWPPQLINLNQFRDTELEFGAVVAESHPHHIFTMFDRNCKIFSLKGDGRHAFHQHIILRAKLNRSVLNLYACTEDSRLRWPTLAARNKCLSCRWGRAERIVQPQRYAVSGCKQLQLDSTPSSSPLT